MAKKETAQCALLRPQTRLNPGRFKQNVKLLNFASHILVLEGHALIVGEGIEIPMINDALLNQTDKVFVMVFHEE